MPKNNAKNANAKNANAQAQANASAPAIALAPIAPAKAPIALGLWGNRANSQANAINIAILGLAPAIGNAFSLAQLANACPSLSKARLSLHLSYLAQRGFIAKAGGKGQYAMAILPKA